MSRGTTSTAAILLVLAIGLTVGCAATKFPDIAERPMSSSLLFGCGPSANLATQIGRSEWPATLGRIEGAEQTIYIEYYRDYKGDAFLERNNPRTTFRSYRVGTQYR